MKTRLRIGKIIGFLGICIFATGISYTVNHILEKDKYLNGDLVVTFEDTKEFTLENTDSLTKEEAKETYPYIFQIENKVKRKTEFNLVLNDNITSSERANLNYLLYKNDEILQEGTLDKINDNILATSKINSKAKDTYKLYIYFNKKIDDASYTYSLKVDAR